MYEIFLIIIFSQTNPSFLTQASLCRKTVSKGRRDDTLRPAGILFLFFRIFPDGGYIISVDELFASLVVRDLDPAVFDGEDRPDTAGRNVSYDFAALADHIFNKFIHKRFPFFVPKHPPPVFSALCRQDEAEINDAKQNDQIGSFHIPFLLFLRGGAHFFYYFTLFYPICQYKNIDTAAGMRYNLL